MHGVMWMVVTCNNILVWKTFYFIPIFIFIFSASNHPFFSFFIFIFSFFHFFIFSFFHFFIFSFFHFVTFSFFLFCYIFIYLNSGDAKGTLFVNFKTGQAYT